MKAIQEKDKYFAQKKREFLAENPDLIPLSTLLHNYTKEEKTIIKNDISDKIILVGKTEYIHKDTNIKVERIKTKGSAYIYNVVSVLNILIKYYRYLSSVISIVDNVAYIHDIKVIYDTKKQRAFFNDKDAMFYLRDLIIANEPELKYNNIVLGD